ncbi:transglutaminase-like domain-containing protein [Halomicroarcula sp. S1AR25-4]|uniref:transglutaminase family protein n=1 Tax=Haloarcula sp. S1AR25-4 TaxID=2950538 RepID=UPI0028769247|nr:transglutaminase-like domain-containing protein [Halomicroarcula sp. S1AR25-4]MDS0278756.1 transglutaminase-like domain-containing protein [Halomicroarcula sp. S1AR25-4]
MRQTATVDANRVLSVTLALLCVASFGLSAPLLSSGPVATPSAAGAGPSGDAVGASNGDSAATPPSGGQSSDADSQPTGDRQSGDTSGTDGADDENSAETSTTWDESGLEGALSQSADGGLGARSQSETGTSSGESGQSGAGGSGGSGSAGAAGAVSNCTRADAARLGLNDPAVVADVVGQTCAIGPQEDPYWRTVSYARYTGSGWQASDAERSRPASDYPRAGQQVRLRYTVVNQTAAVPVPWRPEGVDGLDADGVATTGAGVEPASAALPNGTTYTATATLPGWSTEDLQTAGRAYPADVERRYTQMPADTPDRLRTLTDEVTRNATTPYERAILIEQWLQTEKAYSTQIVRPSEHYATTFATEMERGYCMYFASTMVAMLRTQGVPARYVQGYAPASGRADDGSLRIDRSKAHAWVEVYVPETGWVTFDPTPADREALRESGTTQASFDRPETDPNFARTDADRVRQTAADRPPEVDADVRLDGRVVPGNEIQVVVTLGGQRLGDALVTFNGEAIGRTDGLGRVDGVVPYATQLNVSVYKALRQAEGGDSGSQQGGSEGSQSGDDGQQGDGGSGTQSESGGSGAGQSPSAAAGSNPESVGLGGSITIPDSKVLYHVDVVAVENTSEGDETNALSRGSFPDERPSPEFAQQTGDGGGRELNTTIGLSSIARRTPGTNATVRAEIEGVPVADATVRVDGVAVTTTDSDGTASVRIPYQESFTVTVTRGDAEGARTYDDIDTDVDVTASGLSNATTQTPGTETTVRAAINGVPVPNATVRVAGDIVGQTDADGESTVRVPYDEQYRIVVRRSGADGAAAFRGTDLNVSLDVGEARRPGETVRVAAAVDGVPVRQATVTIGGQRAGRTDDEGVAVVTVPYVRDGPLTVSRGEATAERAFAVRSNTSLTLARDPVPGQPHRVTATLAGDPFRGATVLVDGERRGRTDENGTATVTVPYRERLNVTVRRGELSAAADAPLPTAINVSLEGRAIPGQQVTGNATIAGHPVPNATVLRGDTAVARTAANGRFVATVALLPPRPSFQRTVQRGATRGHTTGPLWPFYGGAAALLVGAVVGLIRRYGLVGQAARGGAATAGLTRRAIRWVVDAVLAAGEMVAAVGRTLVDAVRRASARIEEAIRQAPTVVAALGTLLTALAAWLRGLPAALRALPGRLRAALAASRTAGGADDAATTEAGLVAAAAADPDAPDETTIATVVEAWVELAERTPGASLTETPIRVASAAKSHGYPSERVERITDAFRHVRYGHYPLDTDTLAAVTEAATDLGSDDDGASDGAAATEGGDA